MGDVFVDVVADVVVDVVVDVIVDVVVDVVIFVDVLDVVIGGLFEVEFVFVLFNCVVNEMGGGVVNANVPEPPIALFTPVELFSVLIGSVISDIINISS